jgi:hypothetical protein
VSEKLERVRSLAKIRIGAIYVSICTGAHLGQPHRFLCTGLDNQRRCANDHPPGKVMLRIAPPGHKDRLCLTCCMGTGRLFRVVDGLRREANPYLAKRPRETQR